MFERRCNLVQARCNQVQAFKLLQGLRVVRAATRVRQLPQGRFRLKNLQSVPQVLLL